MEVTYENILLFVLCCKFFVLCFFGYHQHSVLYIPIINIWYQRNLLILDGIVSETREISEVKSKQFSLKGL
jgi:hypothetical protein